MLTYLTALLAAVQAHDVKAVWDNVKKLVDTVLAPPGAMRACPPDECEEAAKCCEEIVACCRACAAAPVGAGGLWIGLITQFVLQVLPEILAILNPPPKPVN